MMEQTSVRARRTPIRAAGWTCLIAALCASIAVSPRLQAQKIDEEPVAAELPSAGLAAERLAQLVEHEIRYTDDTDLNARVLVCVASAEDLSRIRRAGGLDEKLKDAFFAQDIRLLLVEDEIVSAALRTEGQRPARAMLAFRGDAEAGQLRLRGVDPEFSPQVVAFQSRPWVASFEDYQARLETRAGRLAMTGSSELEGSIGSALHGALEAAGWKLRREAARLALARGMIDMGDLEAVTDRLATLLPDDIIERNFLTDKYVEEDRKPYGSVYRAAVLLEADPRELTNAVRAVDSGLDQERMSLVIKAGAIALLAPILLLVFLWLDSATRGYLSGVLKAAFVVGFGGISWLILQMSL